MFVHWELDFGFLWYEKKNQNSLIGFKDRKKIIREFW
jgi:hypothetical protein